MLERSGGRVDDVNNRIRADLNLEETFFLREEHAIGLALDFRYRISGPPLGMSEWSEYSEECKRNYGRTRKKFVHEFDLWRRILLPLHYCLQ